MRQQRNILAQGDRDGACILYAITNGIQSLISKSVKQPQWDRCIKQLPFKIDDFFTGHGTEKLDDNYLYFEAICSEFCKALKTDLKLKSHHEITSIGDFRRLISAKSVMLCTIYGGAHWITVVDVDGENIYMACSAQALQSLDDGIPYIEGLSPRFERYFNLKLRFDELELWKNYGLFMEHT